MSDLQHLLGLADAKMSDLAYAALSWSLSLHPDRDVPLMVAVTDWREAQDAANAEAGQERLKSRSPRTPPSGTVASL